MLLSVVFYTYVLLVKSWCQHDSNKEQVAEVCQPHFLLHTPRFSKHVVRPNQRCHLIYYTLPAPFGAIKKAPQLPCKT